MNHKEILEGLIKEDRLDAYVILWYNKNGDNFIFGGTHSIVLGMLTYAQKAMEDYMAKARPLVQASDATRIVPGGSA